MFGPEARQGFPPFARSTLPIGAKGGFRHHQPRAWPRMNRRHFAFSLMSGQTQLQLHCSSLAVHSRKHKRLVQSTALCLSGRSPLLRRWPIPSSTPRAQTFDVLRGHQSAHPVSVAAPLFVPSFANDPGNHKEQSIAVPFPHQLACSGNRAQKKRGTTLSGNLKAC